MPAGGPKLALATDFDPTKHNIVKWFVSVKYDGHRASWDGSQLRSRAGKVIRAPEWWSRDMPRRLPKGVALDGELWVARQKFAEVGATVRRKKPLDSQWRKLKFMLFDLVGDRRPFAERYESMKTIVHECKAANRICSLRLVKNMRLRGLDHLQQKLKEELDKGGEGLMLREPNFGYEAGRTWKLLKVKPVYDAEVRVIGILREQGRITNLRVRLAKPPNTEFNLGTGFTEDERESTTHFKIGDVLTIEFNGFTAKGVPRHARYMRHRIDL